MDLIRAINTTTDAPFIYVSMDTAEGGCFGHWMWEVAIFLPHIRDLRKKEARPLKILLNEKRAYKTNVLSDFGFYEADIVYSTKMVKDGNTWQEKYVAPTEASYMMYVPKFFYVWNTTPTTYPFFEALHQFREFYISSIPLTTKTTPILYVARSRKENYAQNARTFVNMEDFRSMLHKNGVKIMEVDTLTSLTPQFQEILSASVIIAEMGSAFTINGCFIASNSRIVVINDMYNYPSCNYGFFQAMKRIMPERKNLVDIFSYGTNSAPFSIDIPKFEVMIKALNKEYRGSPTLAPSLTRSTCVVCDNSEFTPIGSFPQFPIMAISNDSVANQYYDYCPISCNKCKCIQLKNLVDPAILYSKIYTNATYSPTWLDHNTAFSKFIFANTIETSFLEVGANAGALYTLMSRAKKITFTTLDMYKHANLPPKIAFIEGNCETFDFTGYKAIILSHVFEHLYSPLKFIANIQKAGVANVFISIPDFDALLTQSSLVTLYSQHTFYSGFDYIIYMFSQHTYRCETHLMYNGDMKSVMFKFVLDPTIVATSIPSTDIQLYRSIYVEKVNRIRAMDVPSNSYIMPSGIYGQIYYYLIKNKDHIKGFLDNNANRHNHLLYGTDKRVYIPSAIDYTSATIIVCDCPYKDEIVSGLKALFDGVKLMYL